MQGISMQVISIPAIASVIALGAQTLAAQPVPDKHALFQAQERYVVCAISAVRVAAVDGLEEDAAMAFIDDPCAVQAGRFADHLRADWLRRHDAAAADRHARTRLGYFRNAARAHHAGTLEQARTWQACMRRHASAERCGPSVRQEGLQLARRVYDSCLDSGVANHLRADDEIGRLRARVTAHCQVDRQGVALASRLAGISDDERARYQQRMLDGIPARVQRIRRRIERNSQPRPCRQGARP